MNCWCISHPQTTPISASRNFLPPSSRQRRPTHVHTLKLVHSPCMVRLSVQPPVRANSRKSSVHGRGDDNLDPRKRGEFSRRRSQLTEVYDSKTLDSVLCEWGEIKNNLPYDLHVAYMRAQLSSAQLTSYLSTRRVPWLMNVSLIRNFVRGLSGRMRADPGFKYKLILQFVASATSSLWLESERRHERSEKSCSLLEGALAAAATQSFVAWLLASNCDYSSVGWLSSIPNNVFEANHEFKKFGVGQRILSLVRSGVHLFLLGVLVKAAEVVHNGKDSESDILIFRNGLHFGIDCNLRYQMLCGLDRVQVECSDDIKMVMGMSMALCYIFRAINACIEAKKSLEYAVNSQSHRSG